MEMSLLLPVLQETDKYLWHRYHEPVWESCESGLNLAFAVKNGKKRVSEQEARFAFVHFLNSNSFSYAVEFPTEKEYCQSKERHFRKAHFDLRIYDSNQASFINCEFKHGTITPEAHSSFPIKKDLEKILRDPGDGLWFHLLESISNKTLGNLFQVIKNDILSLLEANQDVDDKEIYFHVAVLRHKIALSTKISVGRLIGLSQDDFDEISCDIKRNGTVNRLETKWDKYSNQ